MKTTFLRMPSGRKTARERTYKAASLFEWDQWEPRVFRNLKKYLYKKSSGQDMDLLDRWIWKKSVRQFFM